MISFGFSIFVSSAHEIQFLIVLRDFLSSGPFFSSKPCGFRPGSAWSSVSSMNNECTCATPRRHRRIFQGGDNIQQSLGMGVHILRGPFPQRDRRTHVRSPTPQGLDVHPERFRMLGTILRHPGHSRSSSHRRPAVDSVRQGVAVPRRAVGIRIFLRHGHGSRRPRCRRGQRRQWHPHRRPYSRRSRGTHLHLRHHRTSQGGRNDALQSSIERTFGPVHGRRRARFYTSE
mmetsp:Transcript_6885/g.20616  ORF Transcript_6885/g.20616 Transcript_6885/m.20616 type:complete len:230 (+) Transcript_6885:227-916(+)